MTTTDSMASKYALIASLLIGFSIAELGLALFVYDGKTQVLSSLIALALMLAAAIAANEATTQSTPSAHQPHDHD